MVEVLCPSKMAVFCGEMVRMSDAFRGQTPDLKVGGLIPHAITCANLDVYLCV